MNNKILMALMGLVLNNVMAAGVKVDYSACEIADDGFRRERNPAKLPSVTDALDSMRKKYDLRAIEELDLSDNTICLGGAAQIMKFAADDCPNLRRLCLANNPIYDSRADNNYVEFEKTLINLLRKDNIEEIDLRYTAIANSSWITHISPILNDINLMRKIKWKNQ